jgi:hypothetical protein
VLLRIAAQISAAATEKTAVQNLRGCEISGVGDLL